MQYLGVFRGSGVLTGDGIPDQAVDYELEGFMGRHGQVTGSGEIRMSQETLQAFFEQKTVRLRTEDGKRLGLKFTDTKAVPGDGVAHVDIVGDLPDIGEWHR
jgi:hypothetical protein